MSADLVVFSAIKPDATQILEDSIKKVFTGKDYSQGVIASLISQANEQATVTLNAFNKNFKYMVMTVVEQKQAGSGGSAAKVDMSASCFWN
jgi:hypothetical protein